MIRTRSAFYYGFNITGSNNYFEFKEGSISYFFTIPTKSYLPHELANEISKGMNANGTFDYIVSFNRANLGFDISANAIFSLPVTTGQYKDFSVFSLIGYSVDKNSLDEYSSDLKTGIIYYPQTKLQNYTPFYHFIKTSETTQRKTADGDVEIVSYGEERFMECSLSYITNRDMKNAEWFFNNQNAVDEALAFLTYASRKLRMEFWEDIENNSDYVGCILDKSDEQNGFRLKEMYDKKLLDFYETGKLIFREV